MKILVVVLLLAIVGSLASALFFLVHDQGKSKRTVNALAVRFDFPWSFTRKNNAEARLPTMARRNTTTRIFIDLHAAGVPIECSTREFQSRRQSVPRDKLRALGAEFPVL